ncbi:hypothetical protein GGI42DRAFT_103202 [Trichoderma sp. SZMC 28013]
MGPVLSCPVLVRAWIQCSVLASSAKPLATASSIRLDPSTLFSHGLAAFWQLATMGTKPDPQQPCFDFYWHLASYWQKYGVLVLVLVLVLHDAITISSSLFCPAGSALFSPSLLLSSRSFSHHGVAAVCCVCFFGF